MCTVSWAQNAKGYDLLCNRDERVTRSRALLPRTRTVDSVRYISPVDPDGGGTWIGVNEYGVTICLLNAHPERYTAAEGLVSRGLLVRSLLSVRSPIEAVRRVDTSGFAPFQLVALGVHAPACLLSWDGRYKLAVPDADSYRPLVSSSLDERTAWRQRRREWADSVRRHGRIDVELLQAFHRSHAPRPGPFSVCMHREDASTVSFTHVSVCGSRIRLDYAPDSPCKAPFLVTTTMERKHEQRINPACRVDSTG